MNIYGKSIVLRAISESDASLLLQMINDPETERMLGGSSFPVSMYCAASLQIVLLQRLGLVQSSYLILTERMAVRRYTSNWERSTVVGKATARMHSIQSLLTHSMKCVCTASMRMYWNTMRLHSGSLKNADSIRMAYFAVVYSRADHS